MPPSSSLNPRPSPLPLLDGKAFESVLNSNSTVKYSGSKKQDNDLEADTLRSSDERDELIDERLPLHISPVLPATLSPPITKSPAKLRKPFTYRSESSTASNPDLSLKGEGVVLAETGKRFVLLGNDGSASPEAAKDTSTLEISQPRPRTAPESPPRSRYRPLDSSPRSPIKASNGKSLFQVDSTSSDKLKKSYQKENSPMVQDSFTLIQSNLSSASIRSTQLETMTSSQSFQKDPSESTPKSSFSNTMRRTSRFFRKFGGSSKQSKDSSNGSTPAVPPLPAPSSYSYDRNAPVRSDNMKSSSALRSDNRPRKLSLEPSSPFFGILPLPEKDSLTPPTATTAPRKRSSSQNTYTPAIQSAKDRPASRGSEDDRLRRDLSSWKLDLDGMLGNIGKRTSGYSTATASPADHISAKDKSPGRSPTISIATLTDPSATILPSQTSTSTPSIQLVAPSYIIQRSEGDDLIPTESERTSALPMDGLGLGLETITETTHSRESSQVNEVKSAITGQPDLSNTLSTSSLSTSSTSIPPLLQTRKDLVRQSVVAYPAMRSRSVSPGVSDDMRRSLSKSREPSENEVMESPTSISWEEKAKDFADRCWDEDETFLEAKKIAEWLGSTGRLNSAALCLYIDRFDFTGLRLDMAFRKLCDKLYLKAETQQVDRILEQFSRRFWENNPTCVFGSADVVHAVSYSLLLLNTDLHVVETSTRMLRSQFVKNTLSAINSQKILPSAPGTPGLLFGIERGNDSTTSVFKNVEAGASMRSLDRFSERSSTNLNSTLSQSGAVNLPKSPGSIRGVSRSESNSPPRSFRTPSSPQVSLRGVDLEIESTLKEMYSAIKAQPIFQPMNGSNLNPLDGRSTLSLGSSPYNSWNGMNRSSSRRSATSTISTSSVFKRSSIRGFNSFLGTSSLELPRSSSPTPSTATSLSEDMFSTAYGAAASSMHMSSIGFAKTLSYTIREQQEDDVNIDDDDISTTEEELALSGAPWAKEGIIFRKHYWESTGKRSKDKNWLQVFVVISKGDLKMFRFDGAGTIRNGGTALGGGDWTSNAQNVGAVSLIHALCSPLVPPGYNKDRPHCFVLTLPEGGSYFFQAGTQDLVSEWVSTCNYWSARLSKLPLSGGVSNMEYGWNKVLELENEVEEMSSEMGSIRSGKSGKSGVSARSRASYQSSFAGSVAGMERIYVNDWTPPNVPTGASTYSEEIQLDNLIRHVKITKAELAHHNTLRSGILKLYVPKSANSFKAITNWEKKSSHLLSENVKYQTYVEALSSTIKLRELKKGEKEISAMLKASDEIIDDETGIASTPILETSFPREESRSQGNQRQSVAMSVAMSTVSTQQSNDEFFDSVELSSSSRTTSTLSV